VHRVGARFAGHLEPDPDAVAMPPAFIAFDLLCCDRRAVS
jgi:hypothetical protein